jgi:hypothetical protein
MWYKLRKLRVFIKFIFPLPGTLGKIVVAVMCCQRRRARGKASKAVDPKATSETTSSHAHDSAPSQPSSQQGLASGDHSSPSAIVVDSGCATAGDARSDCGAAGSKFAESALVSAVASSGSSKIATQRVQNGSGQGSASTTGGDGPWSNDGAAAVAAVVAVRGTVTQAVQQLQGTLQAELHEDELQIYDVLGRGGFGTVYHGENPPLLLLLFFIASAVRSFSPF